ncbi:hypothetical protein D3C81_1280900 [compost metagenome]
MGLFVFGNNQQAGCRHVQAVDNNRSCLWVALENTVVDRILYIYSRYRQKFSRFVDDNNILIFVNLRKCYIQSRFLLHGIGIYD